MWVKIMKKVAQLAQALSAISLIIKPRTSSIEVFEKEQSVVFYWIYIYIYIYGGVT